MLLTIWCIFIVLTTVVAVGVPVTWVFSGRQPLTEFSWIKVPFLGVATIVLVARFMSTPLPA